MGFEKTLSKSELVITALFGYGAGFDLMKTLQLPLALGTRNSTILPNPSCWRDSAARAYSASAMERDDLFPCLKALYDTTGPGVKRMLSITVSFEGCSIVLSHMVLVTSLRNCKKNEGYLDRGVTRNTKACLIESFTGKDWLAVRGTQCVGCTIELFFDG